MRALFVQLLLLVLPIVILRFPSLGIISYYWFSLMAPTNIFWGGLELPWAKILAAATLLGLIFSSDRKLPPSDSIVGFLITLFLWTSFTTVIADYPAEAKEQWMDFAKVTLMAVVSMTLIRTRFDLNALVWIFVISISYYVAWGGLTSIIAPNAYTISGPPHSLFQSENPTARVAIMSLPLLFFLSLHSAHRYVRIGLVLVMTLAAVGLLATGSRGGFVGFAAMMFFFWLRSKRKLRLATLTACLAAVVLLVIPDVRLSSLTDRFSTIDDYEEVSTAQRRIDVWTWAVERTLQRPLTGGGFGAFLGYQVSPETGEAGYLEAHSNYFEALGEHGFTGLFLYLLLGVITFYRAGKISKLAGRHRELYWERDLAIMIQCSLVGYFVGGLTINQAFFEPYYALMAMVVALTGIVRSRVEVLTRHPAAERVAPGGAVAPVGQPVLPRVPR